MNRLLSSGHAASMQIALRRIPQLPAHAPLVAVRHASLSAIHRGLRRSERIQYGSVRPREESGLEQSMRTNRRDDNGRNDRTARAMAGAGSARQQAKLHKKLTRKERERLKEEEDEESGRQTRRKRFLDPEKGFGKQSLVYQLKYGVLKNEVPIDSLQQPVRPRPREDYSGERSPRRNDSWGAEKPPTRQQDSFGAERPPRQNDSWNSDSQSTRPQDGLRAGRSNRHDENRSDNRKSSRQSWDRLSSGGGRSRDSRLLQRSTGRDARERRPDGDRDSPEYSHAARKMMPMAIKYTTAASQFLYGRSVVKAALEQSRRKLYNLYVYGGENRIDSHYNQSMIRLAERQGVPVTIVPNDQQRLMDKMSVGRPHNGFVLETSPLPQIPVTSLGKLEESVDRFGFHIERGHQSREEEAVNGTSTFVKRLSGRTPKPLVLLLHEILDPGNLGALLRTASYLGIDAVGITQRSSAALTPVVLKSAAGAVEEIAIFSVDSPAEFLEQSKAAGWTTYAAVAPPDSKLERLHSDTFVSTDDIETRSPLLDKPCVLVLGNEGYGLPRQIRVAADYQVSIPRIVSDSCIDSLNVSVAGALLSHAFIKGVKQQPKPADTFETMAAARREDNGADTSEVLF